MLLVAHHGFNLNLPSDMGKFISYIWDMMLNFSFICHLYFFFGEAKILPIAEQVPVAAHLQTSCLMRKIKPYLC